MATRFVLIRHGETDWNVQKRYMGSADITLNGNGIKQAEMLAARLDKTGIDAVYSSDSTRAFVFARIVFPEFEITKHPGFREMNFGIFEGLTHEEIAARHGKVYDNWLKNPFTVAIPDGESFAALVTRVRSAAKEIATRHGNAAIAVVTHSGPIRALLQDAPTTQDFWGMRPDNASVYTIEVK